MPKIAGPKNTRAPDQERVARLVGQFNGLIKYVPMLMDHPDWSDDQCLTFAREWHALAKARLAKGDPAWNDRIPYCRNIPKNADAS